MASQSAKDAMLAGTPSPPANLDHVGTDSEQTHYEPSANPKIPSLPEGEADPELRRLVYTKPSNTTESSTHAKAPDFNRINPNDVSNISEGAHLFLLEEEGEEVESEDRSTWIMVSPSGVMRHFPPRFDPTDNLYAAAIDATSTMKNIDLRKIHHLGNLPDFIQFCKAATHERMCSAIDEQGWIPFSETYIEVGLRYPFPTFLLDVLKHYDLAITQLPPNNIIKIVCFVAWCMRNTVTESPLLLQKFYTLTEQGGGHYYLKKCSWSSCNLWRQADLLEDLEGAIFFHSQRGSFSPSRPPRRMEFSKEER